MKVAFHPEPLLDCQKLYYMGLDVTTPDKADIVFHWNWTGTRWHPIAIYDKKVINRGTLITEKTYIDEVFKKVYGYSSEALGVWAVEKPDATNGFKDARLVNTKQKKTGCFYQMPFIDCDRPESRITEHRITIMDYKPVISLLKLKTVTPQNLIGRVDAYRWGAEYPEKIEEFCRAYPLEYGELDGIYHQDRFYIFDVNPTPGNAAFHNMPPEQSKEYMDKYKEKLNEWFSSIL